MTNESACKIVTFPTHRRQDPALLTREQMRENYLSHGNPQGLSAASIEMVIDASQALQDIRVILRQRNNDTAQIIQFPGVCHG